MNLAETAKLIIQLDLKGNAAAGIKGIETRLAGLNRQSGQIKQGFKTLGAGIGVAFRNAALIAIPVITGLAAGLIKSVREGQEAAKVQTIFANAIQNSGKVSTQYVKVLNDQQKALMNLAGIDDELIKSSQTRLIQMGLTGEQVAKVTPLVLDFAKATGLDLETATKLAGKSINGNIGALSRYGVMVDKAKAKTDPFAATVDALNDRFAGTTKALSGSLEARLGALRENLANIREEAGMKLLPALTKIVDVAGRKLVPAFGAFIDRILPAVISGVDKFAAILEGGGAERGIKGITDALGPMVELLKLAAAPVKAIVSAFLSLPSQVQGALIGGFAINKLSGGLVGQGLGQIGKGLVGRLAGGLLQRGSTAANPLYVRDVAGGLGGGLGGAAGAAGAIGTGTALVAIAAAVATTVLATQDLLSKTTLEERRANGGTRALQYQGSSAAMNKPLPVDVVTPGLVGNFGRHAPDPMGVRSGVLQRAVAAGFSPSAAAISRTVSNNVARQREQIVAIKEVTNAVKALPAGIRNALGGLLYNPNTPSRPGKDDPIIPRKPSGNLVQRTQNEREGNTSVKVTTSTRDQTTAAIHRTRWGPTPAQAGSA